MAENDPHGLDLSPKPLEQRAGVKPTFALQPCDKKKRTHEEGLEPSSLIVFPAPKTSLQAHELGKVKVINDTRELAWPGEALLARREAVLLDLAVGC